MAIQTGSQAQINMTPLIDVLLVLLIIFMAISPGKSTGLDAKIPQPSTDANTSPVPDDDLVITIGADRSLRLNSKLLSIQELQRTVKQVMALQPGRAVFLKGAKELEYRDVASIIDLAREAGAQRIGLLSK